MLFANLQTLERRACPGRRSLRAHASGLTMIGRQLYRLCRRACYDAVRVEPRIVYVDATQPDLVAGFTRRTFTAMIASIRDPAIADELIAPERFDQGIADLKRTTRPDGVFCYTFFRAVAVKS